MPRRVDPRRDPRSRSRESLGRALLAACVVLAAPATSAASSGLDSPDNGVVQVGRGAAWFVRADDPLAVYYNPAALSRQATGVHLGAHLIFLSRCFSRKDENGDPMSPGNGVPGPGAEGGPDEAVCADGAKIPTPQLAAAFRLTDDLGIGVGVFTPHGVGQISWPESVEYPGGTQPASQRYMLIEASSVLLFPTVSVGYAVTPEISIGAGFVWGMAIVDFTNFSTSTSSPVASGAIPQDDFDRDNDLRGNFKARDLFIPGFVVSALWSPARELDVAAWYRWSDTVRAGGDLYLQSNYWTPAGVKDTGPNGPDSPANVTDVKDAGRAELAIPMEAKLGIDYHVPRAGAPRPKWAAGDPRRRVRDPLSEDLVDVELDFTWANNSAIDDFKLRFLGDQDAFPGSQQIAVNTGVGSAGYVPANGDVPHRWKDVLGVRLGGDYVVLPGELALRAGGFFETKGQDDQYLNVDFQVGTKVGIGGGATYRAGPLDISVAYQHTFLGDIDNGGKGCVPGLSGAAGQEARDAANTCGRNADGTRTFGEYRTRQAVNGGKLEGNLNEVALGATMRF